MSKRRVESRKCDVCGRRVPNGKGGWILRRGKDVLVCLTKDGKACDREAPDA